MNRSQLKAIVRQGTCLTRHRKPAPHPEREASVVIIWWQQTTPIHTPLWRKLGSRHTKMAWRQVPDTLTHPYSYPRIPRYFIPQRNGLIWSSPRGRNREAADTRRPILKRAEHDWMLSTRAGARRACIEVESRQTPKNVALGERPWGQS